MQTESGGDKLRLGVTHWLNDGFDPDSAILSATDFPGSHTNKAIATN